MSKQLYRVYIEGEAMQDFDDVSLALDYATHRVYLSWETRQIVANKLKTGPLLGITGLKAWLLL